MRLILCFQMLPHFSVLFSKHEVIACICIACICITRVVPIKLFKNTSHADKDGNMSHVMRKPAFCICENQVIDQLGDNDTTDRCLCIYYNYKYT